jgi:hypothetical protein
MKEDQIKGGLADKLSLEDISKKFDFDIDKLKKELESGTKVEMEHTDDKSKAKEIAMDHLAEMPDYYTRLEKMEKDAKSFWSNKELKESFKRKVFKKLIK